MRYKGPISVLIVLVVIMTSQPLTAHNTHLFPRTTRAAQNPRNLRDPKPGQPGCCPGGVSSSQLATGSCGPRCGSSTISPPTKCDDSLFIVDCSPGLDTGCTFRSGGPLIFDIQIDRVVGEKQKLVEKNLMDPTATLEMPAFDVDFFGGDGQVQPERDEVYFNDHLVSEQAGNSPFLRGDNDVWQQNVFQIPVDWINFPTDPGAGGTPTPAHNIVKIKIDTANSDEVWCTSIDWATLRIKVARPIVMAHGIFSSGSLAWEKPSFSWVAGLNEFGLPNSNRLNMGSLDSIRNNASKIASEVANACSRWGVDKVNIVAHSKGGIDAREFISHDDRVERLIQIGTPNAGSPLADLVEGISILSIGLPKTVIFNEILGGPAGLQLTRPYMSLYNLTYHPNQKVSILSLAGNYDDDCSFFHPLCQDMDSLLLIIMAATFSGPSDTVVPVSSVFELSYAEHQTFDSSGGNKDATHAFTSGNSGLTGSHDVFDALAGKIKARGMSVPRNASLPAAAPPAAVLHTSSIVGSIQQGQTKTHAIPVDQSTPTSFTMLYPSGNLDLSLISPSGQQFNMGNVGGDPNVTRSEGDILGGRVEAYNFVSPEVGTWTLQVSAPSVVDPSGSASYAITALLQNSSITFSGAFAKTSIHSGESLRLLGTLKNGAAPVTGATVNAKIALPDNSVQNLALHDDGIGGDAVANDGVYTGNFGATSQSGNYRVLYTATRTAGLAGPAFSREDFKVAAVSRSSSSFTGIFQDSGLDTDGDGLFNFLVINAGLNITASATYRVLGTLTDSQGNTHEADLEAMLNPGLNTVSLRFDGEAIFNNRVNGPYSLTSVRLAENNGEDALPVDERSNAAQTAAYNFRAFQHGPLSLIGTGSAVGVDLNGNGLFDLLRVGIDIEVLNAGNYNWSGQITDKNGKAMAFATNSGNLVAGANTLFLDFNGQAIGTNGVDGPYSVTGFLVFGAGTSLTVSNAFTTPAFLASQFEGSFNIVLQDDGNGSILLINSATGNYRFQNCRKGVSISGRGSVTTASCKIDLLDRGPDPKRPDRLVSARINTCTKLGTATVQLNSNNLIFTINDMDITNNSGRCP